MKSKVVRIILLVFLCINILIIGTLLYFLGPVGGNKDVSFIVEEGQSRKEIGESLKKAGLIKSEKVFYGYAVFKRATDIYAAKYDLNTGMTLREIVNELQTGGKNADEITITFKEGLNMREIAKVIEKETDNSYDDVLNLAKDEKYIDELYTDDNSTNQTVENKSGKISVIILSIIMVVIAIVGYLVFKKMRG